MLIPPATRSLYVDKLTQSMRRGKKIIKAVEKKHPQIADEIFEITQAQQALIDQAMAMETVAELSAFNDGIGRIAEMCVQAREMMSQYGLDMDRISGKPMSERGPMPEKA